MKKRMSQKEFVSHEGSLCPDCRSEDIGWDDIDIEGDKTVQEARCHDCGLRFMSIYKLIGYYADKKEKK